MACSRRERLAPRLVSLLLLLLQLGVAGSAAAADAALTAASADAPVHVEPVADPSCAIVHDHLFCQLCRTLGLHAVTTRTDAHAGARQGTPGSVLTAATDLPGNAALLPTRPARAPPPL